MKTKTIKDYRSSVKKKKPVVGTLKLDFAPYVVKIKFFNTEWFFNSKEQAMTHSFNAKNDELNGPL
jgi:hypothetical protein